MNQSSMFPSHQHIGSKISAKIKIYVPSPEQNYFVHFAMRYVPNIKIDLHIFPGFGDAVNNADCWSPVINYVERQFDKYLDAETRVERFPVVDSRVHACLYFIAPTGHTLKPLDIEFMRRIHQRVSSFTFIDLYFKFIYLFPNCDS